MILVSNTRWFCSKCGAEIPQDPNESYFFDVQTGKCFKIGNDKYIKCPNCGMIHNMFRKKDD